MSLDVWLVENETVFDANITHNLGKMAEAAGIYYHLWRPEEINVVFAHEIVRPLRRGIKKMQSDPAKFKAFDAPNGWGTYENFLHWCQEYLKACVESPRARVRVSR